MTAISAPRISRRSLARASAGLTAVVGLIGSVFALATGTAVAAPLPDRFYVDPGSGPVDSLPAAPAPSFPVGAVLLAVLVVLAALVLAGAVARTRRHTTVAHT